MENLFKLLLILGASLFLLVTIIERFGTPISEERQSSLARWIWPLLLLLIFLQLLFYWLR